MIFPKGLTVNKTCIKLWYI